MGLLKHKYNEARPGRKQEPRGKTAEERVNEALSALQQRSPATGTSETSVSPRATAAGQQPKSGIAGFKSASREVAVRGSAALCAFAKYLGTGAVFGASVGAATLGPLACVGVSITERRIDLLPEIFGAAAGAITGTMVFLDNAFFWSRVAWRDALPKPAP